MFHTIVATTALIIAGLPTESQGLTQPLLAHDQTIDADQRVQGRFGVEFRQPEWRDYAFGSPQEMDDFIADKQRNGWELQFFPGELRVGYRLVQWGGSRIFDNLGEARAWAWYLERQLGYQVRFVDN